jgi:hypothetical protein
VVGGRPAGASVVHTLLGAPMPVSLSAARQGPSHASSTSSGSQP